MLCHDVSDIFMETAKLFNYAQKRFHWCHVSREVAWTLTAPLFSHLYIAHFAAQFQHLLRDVLRTLSTRTLFLKIASIVFFRLLPKAITESIYVNPSRIGQQIRKKVAW